MIYIYIRCHVHFFKIGLRTPAMPQGLLVLPRMSPACPVVVTAAAAAALVVVMVVV